MNRPSRMCRRWRDCPLCMAGDKGPFHTDRLNELYFRELERKRCEMGIKRPEPSDAVVVVPGGAQRGESWVLYPTLCEWLASDRYEDGTPRRTSTVTLFADGSGFKASLNDRDSDRVAFVSAAEIEGVLALLEAKLTESSLDWRKNGPGGGKKPRRGS